MNKTLTRLPVLVLTATIALVAAALVLALPVRPAAADGDGSRSKNGYLRSHGGLVESHTLVPRDGDATALVGLVREHWSLLRAKGMAAATPVQVLTSEANAGEKAASIQYVFKWRSEEARAAAARDPEIATLNRRLRARAGSFASLAALDEAYQGFDHSQFPSQGGIELLRGKCNSEVELEIDGERVELNVLNGFVLMHRSPGRDVDGDGNREMYVDILQHGGDLAAGTGFGGGGHLEVYRVGQNEALPQYGIVRAQNRDSDFPATAMWVVHWRIWTSKGPVITDPETPLIFGPTTVQHYPPVGTEFFSASGPVALIHEATGEVVGRLTPKELTAFDIVVTKDDEVDSRQLNQVSQEQIELFDRETASYRPPGAGPATAPAAGGNR